MRSSATSAPATELPRTLLVDCYPERMKNKVDYYRQLLAPLTALDVLDYRATGAGTPTRGYDAVVLSGAPVMLTREPAPEGVAAFAAGLALPTLGICFGHQLLGVVNGAAMDRHDFYEGEGRIRVIEPGELFAGMGRELVVCESHAEFLLRESVERTGWEVLADSGDCPVEAMRHRSRLLFGVQFHPERSGETGRRVVENFYRNVVARELSGRKARALERRPPGG